MDAIRSYCMQLLSRREYSRRELEQRLARQGWSGPKVVAVLDALAAEGWQSDERFAQEFARVRIRGGSGPLRIRRELRERGIEQVALDEAVRELSATWEELIEQVHRKKYGGTCPDSLGERARRWRFLLQRGFTREQIQTLFARIGSAHCAD